MSAKRREPQRLLFSKTRLQALVKPDKGRVYYYDEKTPSLALCVTSNDSRIFYLYKKAAGKPVRVRLGRFPDLTVEAARKQVEKLRAALADGFDPQRARREAANELTIGGLFDHWLTYAREHVRSWKEYDRLYRVFVLRWRTRRLSDITRRDIQNLHRRIGRERGHYAANRVLQLLRAAFNRANTDLDWPGENPAARIRLFREESRDRFLQPNEMPRFFKALTEESALIRDFFLTSLLTGARRGNVQSMRWDDVDLDQGLWRIPESKSGKPVLIPLVVPCLRILEARLEASNGSPWVFPAKSKTGHIVEPKSAWGRICRRANLTDLRMHDLRRTLGSWQVATGATLPMVSKMLGHEPGSRATAVYARLELNPVREAAERATSAMLQAGGMLEGPEQKGGDHVQTESE